MNTTLSNVYSGKSGRNYKIDRFDTSAFDFEIAVNLELKLRAYPNQAIFDFLQKEYEQWKILAFGCSVKPEYLGMEIIFPGEKRRFMPAIILELQIKANEADRILQELDNILDNAKPVHN